MESIRIQPQFRAPSVPTARLLAQYKPLLCQFLPVRRQKAYITRIRRGGCQVASAPVTMATQAWARAVHSSPRIRALWSPASALSLERVDSEKAFELSRRSSI